MKHLRILKCLLKFFLFSVFFNKEYSNNTVDSTVLSTHFWQKKITFKGKTPLELILFRYSLPIKYATLGCVIISYSRERLL